MKTDAQSLIVMALIGILAGFLASVVVGGGGGLLWYLIIGLVGSFFGGLLFGPIGTNLGISNPIAAQIVTATIGAIIVLILARLIA